MNKEIKVCSRCVLDTTVEDIWFDDQGVCKYCYIHDEMEKKHQLGPDNAKQLENLIARIKHNGRNNRYDCVSGVSGGRDSTYTLLTAVRLGLRPLAVHFDNGWNSDIAVKNIKNACEKLNVDLYTVVADWEEFKDLQVAFLKSSTPDADIPTDYAIYSVLFDTANREGLKYILNGHSFRTEGTSPISWTYMDPLYVKDVLKKFGKNNRFRSFPHMSLAKLQYYIWVKRIKEVRLMEYMDYNQREVDTVLKNELGWQYYGGHHHENLYTRFFQSYYLPKKFNIDKRKTELSALIRSGQIQREEALKELNNQAYEYDESVVRYAIGKLGIEDDDWTRILNADIKSSNDFKTLLPLIRTLKGPIKLAARLNVIPQILHLKYAAK